MIPPKTIRIIKRHTGISETVSVSVSQKNVSPIQGIQRYQPNDSAADPAGVSYRNQVKMKMQKTKMKNETCRLSPYSFWP
jgi:hypothetical protein